MKLTHRRIDALVERVYYAHCSGIPINILDIGKVFHAGRTAYAEVAFAAPADIEAHVARAIVAFVQTIKHN